MSLETGERANLHRPYQISDVVARELCKEIWQSTIAACNAKPSQQPKSKSATEVPPPIVAKIESRAALVGGYVQVFSPAFAIPARKAAPGACPRFL